jgi:hypothetical protein
MVIVADDHAAIEADLPPGRLCCPHCPVGVLEAGVGRGFVRCGRVRGCRDWTVARAEALGDI